MTSRQYPHLSMSTEEVFRAGTEEGNVIQDPTYWGSIECLTVAFVPINVPALPGLGGARLSLTGA